MKHRLVAIAIIFLIGATSVFADDAPAKTSTVGGGIPNPWRNPFRTCILSASGHPQVLTE